MSFRLVPNSVTLDDLKRRNSPNGCVITEFGSFRDGLRKSGWRYTNTFCSGNGQRFYIVFNEISSMAIFAGDHPSDSDKW